MKVLFIKLKNVAGIYAGMQLTKLEIDFNKNDKMFNLLNGSNGSGKSTIINSISPYATEKIRKGKKGYKEIHYRYKDNIFIIKHFYEPTEKSHTTKSFISMIDSNGVLKELNDNGNVTSFKEIVNAYFGTNTDTIHLLTLGTDMSSIVKMTPAKRKDFMTYFTNNTDIYLSIYKKINSDCITIGKLVKNYADKLNSLGKLDDIKNKIDDVDNNISIIEEEETKTIINMANINNKMNLVLSKEDREYYENHYSEFEKNINRKNKLEEKIGDIIKLPKENLVSSLKDINNEIEKLNIRKTMNESNRDNINKILDGLQMELHQTEKNIEKNYIENIDDLDDLLEYKNYIDKNKSFYQSIDKDINILNKDMLIDIEKFFKLKSSELNSLFDNLDYDIIEKFDYPKDYNSLYIKACTNVSENTFEINSLENELDKHNEIFKSEFSCDNIKCPLLKRLTSECRINKSDIENNLEEVKNKTIDLNNQLQNYFYLNKVSILVTSIINKINVYDKKVLTLLDIDSKKILINIKNANTNMIDYDNLMHLIELVEFNNEYNEKLIRYNQLSSLKNTKDLLDAYILQKEKINDNIKVQKQSYEENIKECNLLNESIIEKTDLVTNLSFVIDNKDTFDSLSDIENRLIDIKNKFIEYNKLNETINTLQYTIDNILIRKEELYKERDKYIFKKKTLIRTRKQKELYEYNYKDLLTIKKAVSNSSGIPLIYVQNYLQSTRLLANKLIKKVFEDTIELGKFKINEKEFKIPVLGLGDEVDDISEASAGERAIISLALSLSLLKQNNSKYNILILDELDGPLDSKKRRLFLYLLEKQIKKLGIEQVFIISHNELFNDYPLNLILLKGNTVDISGDKDVLFNYEN